MTDAFDARLADEFVLLYFGEGSGLLWQRSTATFRLPRALVVTP